MNVLQSKRSTKAVLTGQPAVYFFLFTFTIVLCLNQQGKKDLQVFCKKYILCSI